ncbi:unnamed protein product, partial [marine sediment metagenome]
DQDQKQSYDPAHVFVLRRGQYLSPHLSHATIAARPIPTMRITQNRGISFAIYGMKINELQDVYRISASDISMIGYTSAYTDYNTSEFYGTYFHEINVTSIVKELISAYHWDGHGRSGDETGDAIGFHILGDKG